MQILNVALCAYGLSGKVFHAPFIRHHPGFHLKAVLERTRSESKADYPDVVIHRSLEALLADETIDLVVVNTPNHLHFDHAAAALRAGKHVIVEKPFSSTVAEAEALLNLARERNRFLTVYHNRRYDADFLTVKKVIESGVLGTLTDAEFRFERYKPSPGPKRFKEEPMPASGYVYDLGSHLVDSAVALFGRPKAVYADIRKLRPGTLVEDAFELVLQYKDQLRIRLFSSQTIKHPLPAFSIHGLQGSFVLERCDPQEAMLITGHQPSSENWAAKSAFGFFSGDASSHPVPVLTGNYMRFYYAVYESIINGIAFPIRATEIVDVITILQAALKSNADCSVVHL